MYVYLCFSNILPKFYNTSPKSTAQKTGWYLPFSKPNLLRTLQWLNLYWSTTVPIPAVIKEDSFIFTLKSKCYFAKTCCSHAPTNFMHEQNKTLNQKSGKMHPATLILLSGHTIMKRHHTILKIKGCNDSSLCFSPFTATKIILKCIHLEKY